MAPVFRFAPSPNGELHLGHALSALLNFEMARRSGGRFLLRIEDIDPARCRPEYEAGIYEDLRWLGLSWEEPVRRQSEHVGEYLRALDELKARGLVYPAFLSRAEVKARVTAFEAGRETWPRDPDGTPLYPTEERALDPELAAQRIAAGERHMWRLDMERAMIAAVASGGSPSSDPSGHLLPAGEKKETAAPARSSSPPGERSAERSGSGVRGRRGFTFIETSSGIPETIQADPSLWGDVVLWRWDAPSSYHLAVVLDDALQSVTHVVRGRDLYQATPVHRLLQALFGLPEPVYLHHPLLLDDSGEKLSKSLGSTGLRELRESGLSPSDIRRRIGLDRLLA